jgi:hypothetical protein
VPGVCYAVFHHLASPASLIEQRTGLQLALDVEVDRFRNRKLEGKYPYIWLDATVRHEAPHYRVGGRSPPTACRSRPPKLEAA